MTSRSILSQSAALACLAVATAAAAAPPGLNSELAPKNEPPALGVHWARGEGPARSNNGGFSLSRSPNMTYHGGKIMPQANTLAIFRGTSWATYPASGDKMTGIDSFYGGYGGSNYSKTTTEYTGYNGTVSTAVNHSGHIVDPRAETSKGSTSAVLSEVCSAITANNISPDAVGNSYYALYSDQPRGSARYCAWHSSGTCIGQQIQYAFFFNLDGDPGCDPQDTSTTHSQGLAAIANVSAHELAEAMTDPASPGAWYDSSGYENADKCAWTFNVPYVTFIGNSTSWKLQGEWSNKAYTNGTGYPNSSGQKGCVDGH